MITIIFLSPRPSYRGVSRSSRDAGRVAVAVQGRKDERPAHGGPSCAVPAGIAVGHSGIGDQPRYRRQSGGAAVSPIAVGKTVSPPGVARSKPPTPRAGCRATGVSAVTSACAHKLIVHRAAGSFRPRHPARPSLKGFGNSDDGVPGAANNTGGGAMRDANRASPARAGCLKSIIEMNSHPVIPGRERSERARNPYAAALRLRRDRVYGFRPSLRSAGMTELGISAAS